MRLRRWNSGGMLLPLAPLLALFALLFSWVPGFGNLPGFGQLPGVGQLPGLGQLPGSGGLPGAGGLPGSGGLPGTGQGSGSTGSGSTGSGSTGTGSTGTGSTGSGGTGQNFSGNFTNSAGTRAYYGYIPSTYKAGTALPLVVVLHGCTQTADVIRQQTKFDALAESQGFITVYPEQPSSANSEQCWNWFQTADMSRGAGEPSIIAGITQWVQQHYTVDAKRVYVAGFSAGAAMADVMGATYPDLYAAIGVGSGIEYNGGTAALGGQAIDPTQAGHDAFNAMGSFAREVPALIFHGQQDTTVPVNNAAKLVQQWQTTDSLAEYGSVSGSFPTSAVSTHNATSPGGQAYTVSSYNDGQGHEVVQEWLVANMGHAWSGGCSCESYSYPSGPDETQAMYSFFVQHPMP